MPIRLSLILSELYHQSVKKGIRLCQLCMEFWLASSIAHTIKKLLRVRLILAACNLRNATNLILRVSIKVIPPKIKLTSLFGFTDYYMYMLSHTHAWC